MRRLRREASPAEDRPAAQQVVRSRWSLRGGNSRKGFTELVNENTAHAIGVLLRIGSRRPLLRSDLKDYGVPPKYAELVLDESTAIRKLHRTDPTAAGERLESAARVIGRAVGDAIEPALVNDPASLIARIPRL